MLPGSKRLAALDVGSNSVRLLVADVRANRVIPVLTQRETTRLFSGISDGNLHTDSIARTADAIARLCDAARQAGAQQIHGFGTSAMRDGWRNSGILVERAAQCGADLRILTGEEEAALAYAGAAPDGLACVLDIGGGSTEILRGQDGKVLRARSAQMGAVRLLERANGRIERELLLDLACEALEPCVRDVLDASVDRFVGTGGSVTALCAMNLRLTRYDPSLVQDQPLSAAQTRDWLNRLCALPVEQRRCLPGLNPERADIIPCGAAILCAFFALSGAESLYVSDSDNLTGFLRRLAGETLRERR